jgi:hypothetical protein
MLIADAKVKEQKIPSTKFCLFLKVPMNSAALFCSLGPLLAC